MHPTGSSKTQVSSRRNNPDLELGHREEAELALRVHEGLGSTRCSKRQSQQLAPGQVPRTFSSIITAEPWESHGQWQLSFEG